MKAPLASRNYPNERAYTQIRHSFWGYTPLDDAWTDFMHVEIMDTNICVWQTVHVLICDIIHTHAWYFCYELQGWTQGFFPEKNVSPRWCSGAFVKKKKNCYGRYNTTGRYFQEAMQGLDCKGFHCKTILPYLPSCKLIPKQLRHTQHMVDGVLKSIFPVMFNFDIYFQCWMEV